MSTITRELAKLFRKITNSEIDAEGNAHVVLSPADSLLINNARIALASLEAEASGRNPVLAYADSYRNMANHGVESIPVWSVITDLERNIAPLFTAPPAPVSVPDEMEMDDDFDSAFEHGKAVGWNACRDAMLQTGNSPATPYTWIQVNKSMPEPGRWLALYGQRVFTHGSDSGKPYEKPCVDQGYLGSDGKFYFLNWDYPGDIDDSYNNDLAIATHWMYWELPAAPKQEVK